MKRLALVIAAAAATSASAQDELPLIDGADLTDLLRPRGVTLTLPSDDGTDAAEANTVIDGASQPAQAASPPVEINLPIQFRKNSSDLDFSELRQVEALCTALLSLEDIRIRLVGHTDASGSADYNLQLSFARAASVRAYLTQDCGIARQRIEIDGYGEEDLLPEYRENHPIHRRVQIERL